MTEDLAVYTQLVKGDRPLALAPYVVRLLAQGEPVWPARVAAAAGWPEAKTTAALRDFPRADWNEHGRLVGLGLTLRPTPYRFVLEGRTLFAWCAMDTLIFPVMLGQPARVESFCPVTATPISMTVWPDGVADLRPSTAVVSETPPVPGVSDLRSTVCDHTAFLATVQAGHRWRAEHPGGQLSAVEEAFARARERTTRLGWAAEIGPA